jgi:hypothetical protein
MYLAVEKHKIIVINIVNFNSVIIDAVIIIKVYHLWDLYGFEKSVKS